MCTGVGLASDRLRAGLAAAGRSNGRPLSETLDEGFRRIEDAIERSSHAAAERHRELLEFITRLHSDAWQAADTRSSGTDQLIRLLHSDEDTVARQLHESVMTGLEVLQGVAEALQQEIAIDYESSIEAMTYVSRSLRELTNRVAEVSGSGDAPDDRPQPET